MKNLLNFQSMKTRGEKITWITAYDFPFAQAAESAGVDMILVGDSGGMVQLGYKTTNPVTMDEMIILSRSVRRGAPNTFIVGDMPQGSYEVSPEKAVENALRFIKEAGVDAVKLEGGARVADKVKAIHNAGILVIGHLGLTPQSTASFGGYKVQCKTPESFDETIKDAISLEKNGACMILLEAMPEYPGEVISSYLNIPIMGIGAGGGTDGQLIIMHDLIGFYQSFRPWFAKCYIPEVMDDFVSYIKGNDDIKTFGREERKDGMWKLVEFSISKYIEEVKSRKFPCIEYTYPIKEEDLDRLKNYWNDTNSIQYLRSFW